MIDDMYLYIYITGDMWITQWKYTQNTEALKLGLWSYLPFSACFNRESFSVRKNHRVCFRVERKAIHWVHLVSHWLNNVHLFCWIHLYHKILSTFSFHRWSTTSTDVLLHSLYSQIHLVRKGCYFDILPAKDGKLQLQPVSCPKVWVLSLFSANTILYNKRFL